MSGPRPLYLPGVSYKLNFQILTSAFSGHFPEIELITFPQFLPLLLNMVILDSPFKFPQ